MKLQNLATLAIIGLASVACTVSNPTGHVSARVAVVTPRPVYVAPRPVYVAPRPVYYSRPTYVAPAYGVSSFGIRGKNWGFRSTTVY